jgi:hypothetical protein
VLVGTTDTLCVFCGAVEESVDHLFVSCEHISPIWYRISRWLRMEYVSPNRIMQVFESFFGMGVGRRVRLGMILVWHMLLCGLIGPPRMIRYLLVGLQRLRISWIW